MSFPEDYPENEPAVITAEKDKLMATSILEENWHAGLFNELILRIPHVLL
jgi:hypothetical protein